MQCIYVYIHILAHAAREPTHTHTKHLERSVEWDEIADHEVELVRLELLLLLLGLILRKRVAVDVRSESSLWPLMSFCWSVDWSVDRSVCSFLKKARSNTSVYFVIYSNRLIGCFCCFVVVKLPLAHIQGCPCGRAGWDPLSRGP